MRKIIILSLILILIPIVSAEVEIGVGTVDNQGVMIEIPEAETNFSEVNVNDSRFWQGYEPTTLPHNIIANLAWSVAGHIIDTDFLPNADDAYNLGSETARWLNLWLSGNITTPGNVTAANFIGNGSQLTGIEHDGTGGWQNTSTETSPIVDVRINDSQRLLLGDSKDVLIDYDGSTFDIEKNVGSIAMRILGFLSLTIDAPVIINPMVFSDTGLVIHNLAIPNQRQDAGILFNLTGSTGGVAVGPPGPQAGDSSSGYVYITDGADGGASPGGDSGIERHRMGYGGTGSPNGKDGQFLIDGSGHLNITGNFTGNEIYGYLNFHDDNGNEINLVTSMVYEMINNYNTTTGNGVGWDGNGTLIIGVTGRYEIGGSVAFESGVNSEHGFDFALDSVIQNIHAHRTIGTGNQVGSTSLGPYTIDVTSVPANVSLMIRDEAGVVSDPTIIGSQWGVRRVGRVVS